MKQARGKALDAIGAQYAITREPARFFGLRLPCGQMDRTYRARIVEQIKGPRRGPLYAPGPRCELPPSGWTCTRGAGHDGPCAAWPTKRRELACHG
jgi:hypothetical protein